MHYLKKQSSLIFFNNKLRVINFKIKNKILRDIYGFKLNEGLIEQNKLHYSDIFSQFIIKKVKELLSDYS